MTTDNMQLARGRLGLYAGFWLALASKMKWIPCDAARTPGGIAATNGKVVWYNEENMNQRSLGEVVFIALHEVGHPMLCHLIRRGDRDPSVYGVAIDVVLNKHLAQICSELPNLGMEIPKDAIFGHHFGIEDKDVTSVEQVYEIIKQQKDKVGKDGNGGKDMPTFDDHEDPTNDDGSALTETQKDAHQKEWQIAVRTAAVMAKKMGKLPGFMEEFIEDLLETKVDWRSQLWNSMATVGKDESTYQKFDRRHIYRGLYLPGSYSEKVGNLGYFVDVSGSVSSEEATQAITEMNTLLEEMKPELIHFGQIDTRIVHVQELTQDDVPLRVSIKGRGGTDMRDAFAWACEHEDELDCFVLQTDGAVPPLDPSLHPKCKTIILVTSNRKLPSGWEFPTVIRVQV